MFVAMVLHCFVKIACMSIPVVSSIRHVEIKSAIVLNFFCDTSIFLALALRVARHISLTTVTIQKPVFWAVLSYGIKSELKAVYGRKDRSETFWESLNQICDMFYLNTG